MMHACSLLQFTKLSHKLGRSMDALIICTYCDKRRVSLVSIVTRLWPTRCGVRFLAAAG
jgi:hypothetical protein